MKQQLTTWLKCKKSHLTVTKSDIVRQGNITDNRPAARIYCNKNAWQRLLLHGLTEKRHLLTWSGRRAQALGKTKKQEVENAHIRLGRGKKSQAWRAIGLK
ncbi:hypothetical protein [Sodalis sp. C49]|uniref:hypothetical protein n=1 Tax=Sodalis sp. C49 TaxID=3228929 RepID=UPI0039659214